MLIARKIEAKHVNITNSNKKKSQIPNQETIQNIKFKAKKSVFYKPRKWKPKQYNLFQIFHKKEVPFNQTKQNPDAMYNFKEKSEELKLV